MSLKLPTRTRRTIRLFSVFVLLGAYVTGSAVLLEAAGLPAHAYEKGCLVKGTSIWCDGEKIFIKGVGWDPTRPGELPWSAYRPDALVRSDFAQIRAAGFNTVRSWEALTPRELAIAKELELWVLQGIWIPPDGDFADEAFRGAQLDKARRIAAYSEESSAVLGYLVMNEPEPGHIMEIGIDESRKFLVQIADAVRQTSPGALVSFASWPGLEFFDVPDLDFVSVNLYPFRPQVLMDALGYGGVVELWRQLQAENRPLVVTEFGMSVSPTPAGLNEPGGTSEEEQALSLPRLADAIVSRGAAGATAFMWIDGWWKNNDGEGDELTHDPSDGEEWFGLNAMESLEDRVPRPRPALAAMQRWNRAVLTQPIDGARTDRSGAIEIYVEEDLPSPTLSLSVDGAALPAPYAAQRGAWIRADVKWPESARVARISLHSSGRLVGEWQRFLGMGRDSHALSLEVQPELGGRVALATVRDATGRGVPGTSVQFALGDAGHRLDRSELLTTDAHGVARFALSSLAEVEHAVVVAALREESPAQTRTLKAEVVRGETTK
jgi:hypothetical protein